MYWPLIRRGDPEWTLRHLPLAWRQLRDSGTLSVKHVAPGRAELELAGYPVLCSELARVNAGYFETVLKESGAVDPLVRVGIAGGAAHFTMTWKASAAAQGLIP